MSSNFSILQIAGAKYCGILDFSIITNPCRKALLVNILIPCSLAFLINPVLIPLWSR